VYELGEGYDHGLYGHHVACNTCKVFIGQKEGLDIERHNRDTKNSSHLMSCAENIGTLCLFFTILGKCGVVGVL
jgi:hypothetical protein